MKLKYKLLVLAGILMAGLMFISSNKSTHNIKKNEVFLKADSSLKQSLNDTLKSGNISLTGDYILNEDLYTTSNTHFLVNGEANIDLNGYTIYNLNECDKTTTNAISDVFDPNCVLFVVGKTGSLTITNGTISGHHLDEEESLYQHSSDDAAVGIYNLGTLNASNVCIEGFNGGSCSVLYNEGKATLDDCLIQNNTSTKSNILLAKSSTLEYSELYLNNTTIANNTLNGATSYSAGIQLAGKTKLYIEGSAFKNNIVVASSASANAGPAIYSNSSESYIYMAGDTVFEGNESRSEAGASKACDIYVSSSGGILLTSPISSHMYINGNTSGTIGMQRVFNNILEYPESDLNLISNPNYPSYKTVIIYKNQKYSISSVNNPKYSISFQGGSIPDGSYPSGSMSVISLPYGQDLVIPEVKFEADNYKVIGWKYTYNNKEYEITTAEGNVGHIADGVFISGKTSITLTALWEEVGYSISVDNANNCNFSYNKSNEKNVETTFTVTGTKAGYEFDHISVRGEKTGNDYTSRFVTTDNITYTFDGITDENLIVTGYTNKITYNISYDLNGAAVQSELPTTYNVETNFTLPNLVKTGYTFQGWSLNGDTSKTDFTLRAGTTGDLSFVANFKINNHKISKSLGSNVTYNIPANADYGQTVTMVIYPKAGYTNLNVHVYKSSDRSVEIEVSDNQFIMPDFDVIIVCSVEKIVYNISYDLQGGTPVTELVETYTITDSVTLPDVYKEGYTFQGWIGTGTFTPTKNRVVSGTSDRQFTAVFTINQYMLSMDFNTGIEYSNIKQEKLDYGTIVTINDNVITVNGVNYECPKVVNYKSNIATLNYLYNTSNNIPVFGEITITDNITIKANYYTETRYYTVKWLNIDNTLLEEDKNLFCQPISYNGQTPSYTDNIYTYTFTGWSPEVKSATNDSSVTGYEYVAQFDKELIEYTIGYSLDGGVLENKITSYNHFTQAFSLNTPSKEGYTFIGWTSDESDELVKDVRISTGSYGNKHFYANYEINKYSLSIDFYTGVESQKSYELSFDYGTIISVSSNTITILDNTYSCQLSQKNNSQIAQFNYIYKDSNDLAYNGSFAISANTKLSANYTISNRIYIVTWLNCDNTLLEQDSNQFCQPISYNGQTPTYSDNFYDYTFTGWSPEVRFSTNDASVDGYEYVAQYEKSLKVFSISYNLNGGELLNEVVEYTYETPSFTLDTPTRKGYTFTSWTDENGKVLESVTIEKGSYGNRSYKANYTVNAYNIYTSCGQGTSVVVQNSASYMQSVSVNGDAITGYDSLIMTISYDGEEYQLNSKSFVMPASDVLISLSATPIEYIISYNLNGGEVSTNASSYNILSGDIKINNPEKLGYTFIGWTGTISNYPNTNLVIKSGSTSDIELIANYSPINYTITTICSKGVEASVVSNASYLQNVEIHSFLVHGYSDLKINAMANGQDLVLSNNSFVMPASDVVVTISATPITYEISYNLNQGSANNPTTYTVETSSFILNEPTKYGYTFEGWTGSGITKAKRVVQITSGTIGNLSFVANYILNNYTITFDSQGGSDVDSITLGYGQIINEPQNPTKPGYTFIGWFLSDSNTAYEFGTMPASNLTLCARYAASVYSVEYYANGSLITTKTYSYGDEIPTISNPTMEDTIEYCYTFSGWALRDDSTDLVKKYDAIFAKAIRTYEIIWQDDNENVLQKSYVNFGATPKFEGEPLKKSDKKYDYEFAGWNEEVLPVSCNAAYTAIFNAIEKTFVITFVGENSEIIETKKVKYGEAVVAPKYDASMYVEEGYISSFVGWDIKNELNNVTEDKVAHAVVKKDLIKYTINYELDGGLNAQNNPVNYTVEDSITLDEPTRDGFEFAGWQVNGSQDVITDLSIVKGSIGDLNVKSIWVKAEEKITNLRAVVIALIAFCILELIPIAILIKRKHEDKKNQMKLNSTVLAPIVLAFIKSQINEIIILSGIAVLLLITIIVLLVQDRRNKTLVPVAQTAANGDTYNNYFININNLNEQDDEDDEEDIIEDDALLVEENNSIDALTIEENVTGLIEEEPEKKTSAPRRFTLKLRLANSSDQLKARYTTIRNYIESYKIRQKSSKHKDDYYICVEEIIKDESDNLLNKKVNKKLLMLTIHRKQLILSYNFLNNQFSLDEEIKARNIEIAQRRYNGFNFNLRLSNNSDVKLAMELIDKIMLQNNIIAKKRHKDIDYASLLNIPYTAFERKGFGYLVRDSITLEEADKYTNSLAFRSIIVNKLEQKIEDSSKPCEISLDQINKHFKDGTFINLDFLKENGLATPESNKLIVTDGSFLDKRFVIEADGFSSNTVKMIFLAGGEARINKRIIR